MELTKVKNILVKILKKFHFFEKFDLPIRVQKKT